MDGALTRLHVVIIRSNCLQLLPVNWLFSAIWSHSANFKKDFFSPCSDHLLCSILHHFMRFRQNYLTRSEYVALCILIHWCFLEYSLVTHLLSYNYSNLYSWNNVLCCCCELFIHDIGNCINQCFCLAFSCIVFTNVVLMETMLLKLNFTWNSYTILFHIK